MHSKSEYLLEVYYEEFGEIFKVKVPNEIALGKVMESIGRINAKRSVPMYVVQRIASLGSLYEYELFLEDLADFLKPEDMDFSTSTDCRKEKRHGDQK